MWRSLKFAVSTPKGCHIVKVPKCALATSPPKSGRGKKTVIAIVAVAGFGAGATVVYGKYDLKFRKLVEDNIPYSDLIFHSLYSSGTPNETTSVVLGKVSEATFESSLLEKKKQGGLEKEDKAVIDRKSQDPGKKEEISVKPKIETASLTKQTEDKQSKSSSDNPKHVHNETIVIESAIKDLLAKANKTVSEAVSYQEAAAKAVDSCTNVLYEALDATGAMQDFKQLDVALSEETVALDNAQQKVMVAQSVLDNLKKEIWKAQQNKIVSKSSAVFIAEASVEKFEKQLKEAATKVAAAQLQSKTAAEYRELVEKEREQLKRELQTILPKYVLGNKDQTLTEDELNLLLVHALRRIEHLKEELARQQEIEKRRVEEAVKLQKTEAEKSVAVRIESAITHHQNKMEAKFQQQLEELEDEFEANLRHHLRRQAAVHSDYLQEALHNQKQKMQRAFDAELAKNLIHQKDDFIFEISSSIKRLRVIENHFKARAHLDEAAQKTAGLWIACQAMKNALKSEFSDCPRPLRKELALIKWSVGDEDGSFVTTVLSGIPIVAVERGVFSNEHLKHRFSRVKNICRRVAMINDHNRSLYHYLLSYLQSFLIIDVDEIPPAEVANKVAVDPSEWDTFDLLNRISYCVQRNDMEQALRYACQLRGEPYNVAKDWITEVQLFLETSQAVDCLIAYASAISMQGYH